MKVERFINGAVRLIRAFGVICVGVVIALIVEYGMETELIIDLVLSLILIVCTTIKLSEDKQMAKWEGESNA